MKKNSFTLIELLAVITIISIIMIISLPELLGHLKKSKENSLEKTKEIITSAARNYAIDYNITIPNSISVQTLCDDNYIDCPIKNPIDDTNMLGYVNIDNRRNYIYSTYESVKYSYQGDSEEFVAPQTGWYQIELFGAKGGQYANYEYGKGAYVSGKIYLTNGETLYIYVGGAGVTANSSGNTMAGGYNGGGSSRYQAGAGGGATDIRCFADANDRCIQNTTNLGVNDSVGLKSRIMVAGGGGGTGSIFSANLTGGGSGGLYGLNGGNYASDRLGGGLGGTQNSGGSKGSYTYTGGIFVDGTNGGFGSGGNGGYHTSTSNAAGAGGGGYYGGGGGNARIGGGGGGSSFISGYAGVNAVNSDGSHKNNTLHYSEKYFIDGYMQSNINDDNGKAIITYIGESKPVRMNVKLDNVRYIKDCVSGNSTDSTNRWNEIQVIYEGNDIAKNIAPTSTGTLNNIGAVTDGDIGRPGGTDTYSNETCMILDLLEPYDVDEIAVWHTWEYLYVDTTDPVTQVSSDGVNWTTVIKNKLFETSEGKRVSAY